MSLWFNQPELGLPSKVRTKDTNSTPSYLQSLQEYYEEKSIVDVYRDVMQQLLILLDEDDEESLLMHADLTFTAEEPDEDNSWPPWPWPPWGDDDENKPENKTQKAQRLAKKVLNFESKIADASLDLYVIFHWVS
jgi:endothelin-converting enzyme